MSGLYNLWGQDKGCLACTGQDQGCLACTGQDQGRLACTGQDQGRLACTGQDQGRLACTGLDQGRLAWTGQDQGDLACTIYGSQEPFACTISGGGYQGVLAHMTILDGPHPLPLQNCTSKNSRHFPQVQTRNILTVQFMEAWDIFLVQFLRARNIFPT